MTEEEKQKSRALAVFMGVIQQPIEQYIFEEDSNGISANSSIKPHFVYLPKFTTDYNSLMEVWRKFRDLPLTRNDFITEPNIESYLEYLGKCEAALLNGTITDLFNALSDAVIWYNNLKK